MSQPIAPCLMPRGCVHGPRVQCVCPTLQPGYHSCLRSPLLLAALRYLGIGGKIFEQSVLHSHTQSVMNEVHAYRLRRATTRMSVQGNLRPISAHDVQPTHEDRGGRSEQRIYPCCRRQPWVICPPCRNCGLESLHTRINQSQSIVRSA